jgi:hypothetical protein
MMGASSRFAGGHQTPSITKTYHMLFVRRMTTLSSRNLNNKECPIAPQGDGKSKKGFRRMRNEDATLRAARRKLADMVL